MSPALPVARGPLSGALLDALTHAPGSLHPIPLPDVGDPLADDDLQLALYCLYELHYRGLSGVDDGWEWDPGLLALRARLERVFDDGLRAALRGWTAPDATPATMDLALRAIIDQDDRPSLSRYLETQGTEEELRELLIHRSAYQLKEADPHSWALPRLSGGPKAALVEVQHDEYGGGDPRRMHARLFADTLEALGIDATYGALIDQIPGFTLATVNLMSFFGLHRARRGAIVGHLALFEMTSSIPNRRYASALRRLGFRDRSATEFFDEHVTADAVHENIAAVDLAGGLARDEPEVLQDILFGARALVELDGRAAERMLDAWSSGTSSLLTRAVAGARA
jgi:hypothetical protein